MAASIDATLAAAIDTDTTTDEILLAAANHDLDTLRRLFRSSGNNANKITDAKCQDPDTGYSPLHAAIASCEADDEFLQQQQQQQQSKNGDAVVNGEGDAINGKALSQESALATIKLLFENGAIWNELDFDDETPGCMALRLGLKELYDTIVDAGVRAELLFARLDDYELLPDGSDDEEGADEEEDADDAIAGFEPSPDKRSCPPASSGNGVHEFEGFEPSPNPSYKIEDDVPQANGTATEAPNGAATAAEAAPVNGHSATTTTTTTDIPATTAPAPAAVPASDEPTTEPILTNPNVDNPSYLRSNLTYSGDRLLDSDKNAVMMDWETEIMRVSAKQLCPRPGLRTMNVGFGMGIVDSMFLSNDPAEHHIVEAHPQVIERMRQKGWFEKANVKVHQGRWQDVLPRLVQEGVVLDAIYYDTYAEDYSDLKVFFDEFVIALLDSKGLFGFYNGLGADRQVCYDVYKKVAELHLDEAGLDVEWTPIEVPDLAGRGEWEGVKYPYWSNIKTYWLPTCKFLG